MLIAAVLLFSAPTLTAMAAEPQPDCCADMPCDDLGCQVSCPQACVVACQAIVAPEGQSVEPAELRSVLIAPMVTRLPLGLSLAPELPPPR